MKKAIMLSISFLCISHLLAGAEKAGEKEKVDKDYAAASTQASATQKEAATIATKAAENAARAAEQAVRAAVLKQASVARNDHRDDPYVHGVRLVVKGNTKHWPAACDIWKWLSKEAQSKALIDHNNAADYLQQAVDYGTRAKNSVPQEGDVRFDLW